jgi:hypothetical protein
VFTKNINGGLEMMQSLDSYIDGSHNLSAILKLIYPLK